MRRCEEVIHRIVLTFFYDLSGPRSSMFSKTDRGIGGGQSLAHFFRRLKRGERSRKREEGTLLFQHQPYCGMVKAQKDRMVRDMAPIQTAHRQ